MSDLQKDQIGEWLKKLEQESWQLELLVSAFTIFLLIQAIDAFSGFYIDLPFKYNIEGGILTFVYFFVGIMGMSIKALSLFLIVHLMLRGFWIGSIGLRSVQSEVDFPKLKYNDFFNQKLKKRIVSLDDMVVRLDEMCSVIFSFSFLIISVLIAFGLYFLFLGGTSLALSSMIEWTEGWFNKLVTNLTVFIVIGIMITGVVYMIDYFSLGFFKKYKWLGKLYYPVYKFYGFITISVISRSIYYYLISKFSKRKIRMVYLIFGALFFISSITEYDQFQYYSEVEGELVIDNNFYDNLRSDDVNIEKASVPSDIVEGSFMKLFLRYNPNDNTTIKNHCPDFEPLKREGLNLRLRLGRTEKGISIGEQEYAGEDTQKMIDCHSSIYKVLVNDSLYAENSYYFFTHPSKHQMGIRTMLSTKYFLQGANILKIEKSTLDDDGNQKWVRYASVPFWFESR